MRCVNKVRVKHCLPLIASLLIVSLPVIPAVAQGTVPTPGNLSVSSLRSAPPRIVFGGKPLTIDSSVSTPYRDPVDNILCISPDMLAPLGVVYIVDEKMGKVTFTNAEGTTSTTVELRTPPPNSGRTGIFVPAIETVEGLGGKCEWDATTNTLYARSVLQDVGVVNGKLVLRASLPILPTVTRLTDEKKVLIEVVGAEVGSLPRTLTLDLPGVVQARTGQFDSDVARIVLEMRENGGNLQVESTKPAVIVTLNLDSIVARPTALVTRRTPPVVIKNNGVPPTTVSAVTFRRISDDKAQFIVRAGRIPTARPNLTKDRLTLDLLNANVAPNVPEALNDVKHPFLRAVQLLMRGTNAAQLVLDLKRLVNFSVRPDNNGNLVLEIGLPRNAGGTLAGKLVVVDAGHGGHDSGAMGGGYREKNVALAIAFKVADALREAGANVLMTRADDFFIPVNERAHIANRANADFFIVIHADSGDSNHSINGSTVYYHAYEPNCRNLAVSIAQRLDAMGGIKANGVKTDYVRFPGPPDGSRGGFGFLRNARMVAVLVETGFMSNAHDVRLLVQPEMQARIAKAVTAGLKDYIEGNPDLDTRAIRPEAGEAAPMLTDPAGEDMPSRDTQDMPTATPDREPGDNTSDSPNDND